VGLALAAYRAHLAAGAGIVVGAGIGAMHFVGMAAMHGSAHTAYDTVYVAVAFALGMGFGAAALWTASRTRNEWRRTLAAGFLALGILGLHFTAMAAMTLRAEPGHALHHGDGNYTVLTFAVVAVTILILVLGILGTAVDRHLADRNAREAARLRRTVAELETAKAMLEASAAETARARDAAEAGNRAKSQFLAAMSHELRTPLNAVIGFAEMLGREPFGPLGHARYREYIEHIRGSGAHLLKLVDDVLEFSKAAEGALSLDEGAVDVGREIDAALAAMAPEAAKGGVALANTTASRLPPLRADARRVRQILFNLLSNAVKFTPKGGRVSVAAQRRADGLAISVADTGIGIAPKDLATAFERFAQTDSRLARRYEGAGLGLPLTKQLMELHGGTIQLSSAVGQGTTAVVAFPNARVIAVKEQAAAA
jgi:signal transduction histidine kinase